MQSRFIVACIVACTVLPAGASAQSPFDGPLAAPDAPTAKSDAPARHVKTKLKKVRRAAAKPGTGNPASTRPLDAKSFDGLPATAPTAAATPAGHAAPDDPLSVGMKWNGNNDTAGETRSQNLDGSAFGSGAEVGMKLHF